MSLNSKGMPDAIKQKRIVIFLQQLCAQTSSLQETYFTSNEITRNHSNKGKVLLSIKKKKNWQWVWYTSTLVSRVFCNTGGKGHFIAVEVEKVEGTYCWQMFVSKYFLFTSVSSHPPSPHKADLSASSFSIILKVRTKKDRKILKITIHRWNGALPTWKPRSWK